MLPGGESEIFHPSTCLSEEAHSGGNHSDMDMIKVCSKKIIGLPDLTEAVVRRFTTTECERLQTYPDGYTEGVSNTQRYKALGNSFTVDVIAHLLKSLKISDR